MTKLKVRVNSFLLFHIWRIHATVDNQKIDDSELYKMKYPIDKIVNRV